jgi:hypothetical protein
VKATTKICSFLAFSVADVLIEVAFGAAFLAGAAVGAATTAATVGPVEITSRSSSGITIIYIQKIIIMSFYR